MLHSLYWSVETRRCLLQPASSRHRCVSPLFKFNVGRKAAALERLHRAWAFLSNAKLTPVWCCPVLRKYALQGLVFLRAAAYAHIGQEMLAPNLLSSC